MNIFLIYKIQVFLRLLKKMELAQQPETKPVRYRATKQTFEWCNHVRIQDPKQKVSDPPQLHERLLQFRTHT